MSYPYENTTQGTVETLSRIEERLKKEKRSTAEMQKRLFELMEKIVAKKALIKDLEHHIEWRFELN
jgi:Mg2+ and Co2+ transporter CorA